VSQTKESFRSLAKLIAPGLRQFSSSIQDKFVVVKMCPSLHRITVKTRHKDLGRIGLTLRIFEVFLYLGPRIFLISVDLVYF
jgi:hypothetical protein